MNQTEKQSPHEAQFSWRRLYALCVKESKQIIRDPSSALIAVVIPLMLLFIFSYSINLDSSKLRLGILVNQQNNQVREFIATFTASPFIEATISDNRKLLIDKMQAGEIRGMVVIPVDFANQLNRPAGYTSILVITDGSEPNTAYFIQAYTKGIWQTWQQQKGKNAGYNSTPLIVPELRFWFNPVAISQHFIIPGAISIIITVVGAILTSLVVAREWERSTMEALLSTQITRAELLISKLLPYQLLGTFVMLLCMLVTIFILHIPYRGSFCLLFIITSLYLATALGMGLLISTLTRNQFNAAIVALNAAFLPAIILSGFIFEIDSMPLVIQWVTYLIPARYFVSSLQTLFLAGDIYFVLLTNFLLLVATAIIFIGLIALKTRRRLD